MRRGFSVMGFTSKRFARILAVPAEFRRGLKVADLTVTWQGDELHYRLSRGSVR